MARTRELLTISMMRVRTRIFTAAIGIATLSLLVLSLLASTSTQRLMNDSIERTVAADARLVAQLLSRTGAELGDPDDLADSLGATIEARVTLIAADGRVVGDSAEDGAGLAALENHGARPEVLAARATGIGLVRRYSTTVNVNMLYAAVPVDHPALAYARVALPLTEVQAQVDAIRSSTALALAIALASAIALAWASSAMLSRRIRAIAQVAKRYSAGDLSHSVRDYGDDEIGSVAQALDSSVQQLGRRMEEISRERARIGAILSGMAEGVLVLDAQGRLQLANQAAHRMLEIDDGAVGRHYLELIRLPEIVSQLGAALTTGAERSTELDLDREPARTVVARSTPVESSEGAGAVLVLHDVTNLRRADRIRRDFVANVSHELRTPLTAIRGYVEALIDDGPPDPQRRFLDVIARHTARMERLVNDLLRLARLEAGQEVLDREHQTVESLFAGVLAELTPTMARKRQRIVTEIDPAAATVQADAAKLHDALRNLVDNAASYSPEGTQIVLGAQRGSGGIELRVMDEGPGIPDQDLKRVFERFYRVEASRGRDSGGTGLGLAIVKHLVGLHGGSVAAANRQPRGSVFTITLPDPTPPSPASGP